MALVTGNPDTWSVRVRVGVVGEGRGGGGGGLAHHIVHEPGALVAGVGGGGQVVVQGELRGAGGARSEGRGGECLAPPGRLAQVGRGEQEVGELGALVLGVRLDMWGRPGPVGGRGGPPAHVALEPGLLLGSPPSIGQAAAPRLPLVGGLYVLEAGVDELHPPAPRLPLVGGLYVL